MNKIPEGLKYALCALSFFNSRWHKRHRFKNAKKKYNKNQMVSQRTENVDMCRHYITKARTVGFRGSIREQAKHVFNQEAA
ncbi:MAG TPA: hypothetical protein PKO34_00960 [Smithellaceae bacterium]|nr:MAG: hypothetical protein BWY15_02303 [Firmicutes bacterium ADurb.Bin193]HNS55595.1 hypothetical protein [Smithellaceae bacterium]